MMMMMMMIMLTMEYYLLYLFLTKCAESQYQQAIADAEIAGNCTHERSKCAKQVRWPATLSAAGGHTSPSSLDPPHKQRLLHPAVSAK